MDYESRKVKWYWLLLFILYCGGVSYLLFQGNPYLYSRADLRSALDVGENVRRQTIPMHPVPSKLTNPTFQARYNLQRTATDPFATPRSKNFEEYEKFAIDFGLDHFDVVNVTQDASGLFLTGKSPWAVALGLDGKPRWKFRMKNVPPDRGLLPILLDETSVYIVHPQGEVACLDKITGEIRWVLALKEEVVANPLLWKKNLIVPTKNPSSIQMTLINRQSGQLEDENPHLEIKPGFQIAEAPDLDVLVITIDNKVIAVEPEDWQVQWTQTLTDPIKGPAVVVGSQIFVATLGAKIVKLEGAKKGKLEWESDIEKPPAAAPAYLPVIHRLSILDTAGNLAAVDAKTGKLMWRTPTENRGPLMETWSARLKGHFIEEFKMDWLHKGWTIWAPCNESHFCIYTPNKGLLINRMALSGRPLALPLSLERRWVFLTQPKPGHYMLSHLVEDGEIKRLRAEGVKNP